MARAGVLRRAVRAFSAVAIKPVNALARGLHKAAPYLATAGLYGLHKYYQYRRKAINEGIHIGLNGLRGEWRNARKTYLNPRKWWSAYKHHHQPGAPMPPHGDPIVRRGLLWGKSPHRRGGLSSARRPPAVPVGAPPVVVRKKPSAGGGRSLRVARGWGHRWRRWTVTN